MSFFNKRDMRESSLRVVPSLVPRCGTCGLHEYCESPWMPLTGEGKKKILIVGEGPGKTEDRKGIPFVGPAGVHLQNTIEELGFDMFRDCWVYNSIICRKHNNEEPTPQEIDYCRPNLVRVIEEKNPDVIIPLGGSAVRSVIGWMWQSNPGKISKWAGWTIPCQKHNVWICPNYHPSWVIRQKDFPRYPAVQLWFGRYLEQAFALEGKPWEVVPDYRSKVEIYHRPEEAVNPILSMAKSERPVAFDYETDRLKPDHKESRIVCCSLSDGKTAIAFPWTGEVIPAMKKFLLSDVPKIGANIKHEERWTMKLLGFPVNNWWRDTMLGGHWADCRQGVCGLKFMSFVLLGSPSYNDEVKKYLESEEEGGNSPNRIREVDLSTLMLYCGLDSYNTWHVRRILWNKMRIK